jgi:hypothetical protein
MNYFRLHGETLAIAIFLAFSAACAALLGFVSPDSWNYVRLAQSIVDGNACEVNGKYFAIFPCGYPITLALTALSNDPTHIIVISKFVNAALLLASFWFFRQLLSERQFFAALIIIAPSTISISHFTWSENLFLLATALSLLQVHKLASKQSYANQLILLLALLVGISSRYFFGPFAFLIWLSTLLIYGAQAARRTLPVFVIAGLAFVAYYLLNVELTGYVTGMQRIPAPESLTFLIVHFFFTLLRYEIPPFLLVLILFYLLTRNVLGLEKTSADSLRHKKGELLLLATGFSFLVLSFVLRAHTQYDLYGFRTIGYGLTFTCVAIYALITHHKKTGKHAFLLVITLALISFGIAMRGELRDIAAGLLRGTYSYQSIAGQVEEYKKLSDVKGFDNVVSLDVPRVGKTIAENHWYYYDKKTNLISPSAAPYGIPETLDSFLKRISLLQGTCVVDFKTFLSEAEFVQAMQSAFDVDLTFESSTKKISRLKMQRYDAELANFLIENYQHQKIIDCSKLLGK